MQPGLALPSNKEALRRLPDPFNGLSLLPLLFSFNLIIPALNIENSCLVPMKSRHRFKVAAYSEHLLQVKTQEQGFPGGSGVKQSACQCRDVGLIPGLGRSRAVEQLSRASQLAEPVL